MSGKIQGATADYGTQQERYSEVEAERGAPLEAYVRVDGTLNSNIDWRGLPSQERKSLEGNLAGIATTRDNIVELLKEAQQQGKTSVVNDLTKDLLEVDKVLNSVKKAVETLGTATMSGAYQPTPAYQAALNAMKSLPSPAGLDYARSELGVPASDSGAVMDEMRGGAAEEGPQMTEVGEKLMGMTPNDMLTHFSQNPETVWKDIAKLPPEERGAVMQKLQMAVQEDNQLQSMLSNFIKAMHETAKATISNLRV